MPGRIHIVDDDASFRTAIERRLTLAGYQVATYPSAQQLLDSPPDETEPGCILLDVRIPGLSGPELQDRLSELGSTLPIVFLTGHGDLPTGVQAMKNGAADFLEKQAPQADLVGAVRRALEADAARSGLRHRFAHLTERELEVLRHVVRGRMNKQIAADLGIHERTVKLHRTAITTKLGVRSAAELASLARDAGVS